MKTANKSFALAVALLLSLTLGGCAGGERAANETTNLTTEAQAENGVMTNLMQPTLDLTQTEQSDDGWLIITSDELRLAATASGAQKVKFNFSPLASAESDDYIELNTLLQPTDEASGKFITQFKPSEDFAGELWIEATYPDGTTRMTEPVAVSTREASADVKQTATSGENESANNNQNRQDAASSSGEDVYITANVPAFRLTLWENGKATETYEIGVGKKSHPIPIGDRTASQVILNPAWIPPNSAWVRRMSGVNPGERVTAEDSRNPLGNIKIPLGNAYLIHEAAKPSDIGSLVSHGCIRMLTDDIFDLTKRLAQARELSMSQAEIERARRNTERKAARFNPDLPVKISYDTAIIENGKLTLYPDVYERGTNTVGNLRAFLQGHDVDAAKFDDEMLRRMWNEVSMKEMFVVSLDDIRNGRALESGRKEPLTSKSKQEKKPNA